MNIQILKPSGAIFISSIVGTQFIKKTYYGYSKKEAVKLFKAEYNL